MAKYIEKISVPDSSGTAQEYHFLGKVRYATCSTAAATADKIITSSTGLENKSLEVGDVLVVKFSATNTAEAPTFNVDGTGAKSVWYNNAVLNTTTSSTKYYGGYANRPAMYYYDGTYWVFLTWSYETNSTYTNASLGQGYTTCDTAAGTVAKTAGDTAGSGTYALSVGGIVVVKFTNGITVANPTLNINSKGAKKIFYRGAALTNTDLIDEGDIVTLIYDGTQYQIINIEKGLGVGKPMHFIGVSTQAITDGGTQTPIINGSAATPVNGDIVIYNNVEFIWNGSVWESFADVYPSLAGGLAQTNDTTVLGGVTVSGHTVTPTKKTLVGGGATTVTYEATDKIKISSTNTDTTYDLDATKSATNGNVKYVGVFPKPV